MRYLLLLALCLPVGAGCHRGPPPLVKVRGKVTVHGQPLRGGTVVFTPDPKRGCRGPIAYAVLDAQGEFELAGESGPGAVAGWHLVTVAPPPDSPDLIAALERYREPGLSGLEFEVRDGEENSPIFALDWDQ